MNQDKALALAEAGLYVFPATINASGQKVPLNANGFSGATVDPDEIRAFWSKNPEALIGVATAPSRIIVLDVDVKYDPTGSFLVKDGFASIDSNFYEIPDTFATESINGLGMHYIYQAPEHGNYPRKVPYRGMKDVDRISGDSYVVWTGGVPNPGDFKTPPDWLLDEGYKRDLSEFEGSLDTWLRSVPSGEPNALMRKAMDRAEEIFEERGKDLSHGDMTERQFEVVRLAAEGNPGVESALEYLEVLFLSRTGEHSRSEELWEAEWAEALQTAIEKYGALTEQLATLPEYNIGLVPSSVPDNFLTEKNTGKEGFSKLLGALVKEIEDDSKIASILWNCVATQEISREWGLQFVFKRIAEARVKPEPTRENPKIEEARERELAQGADANDFTLLTKAEREHIAKRPTYVDHVVAAAKAQGYDQLPYFRGIAWITAAMAFSFKGFIPLSKTHKMGLNLWIISPGESGTGKAQPLTSQVLTPEGFKEMGSIQVGDTVVVPSGGTAKVTGVFPQGVRPVYKVTFKDGRIVEADAEHLWSVKRPGKAWYSREPLLRTTKQLLGDLTAGSQGKSKWNVETVAPADLGTWSSTIPPYALGLLLGDGGISQNTIRFTTSDEELVKSLQEELPAGMSVVKRKAKFDYALQEAHPRDERRWVEELRRLGLMGKLSKEKSVPADLLNSSVADRLALLQGIMDTDGTPNNVSGNSADIVLASEELLDNVVWLVRSLGGRATKSQKQVKLKGWDAPRTYFRSYLTLPSEFDIFRLPAKRDKVVKGTKYAVVNHPIRAIEFKGFEPTQCIEVDHPDHEYVTDEFTRTHNTVSSYFRDAILKPLFANEPEDVIGYDLGEDSSPPGLHVALLERDRRASLLSADEATGFFTTIAKSDWRAGTGEKLTSWYNGFVAPANKLSQKELRGKSALTSFNMHMFGTPDKMTQVITQEMFETGFMARVNWVFGNPARADDSRFDLNIETGEEVEEFEGIPQEIEDLATDLVSAVMHIENPVALKPAPGVMDRLSEAYKRMYRLAEGRENWQIIEPSITRLSETMMKCAGICAMYRSDNVINMDDALHAINAVEEFYQGLHRVAAMVSAGDFQRNVDQIEEWVRVKKNGRATKAAILTRFKNMVMRDPRELDNYLNYLVESGAFNKDEGNRGVAYEVNGG